MALHPMTTNPAPRDTALAQASGQAAPPAGGGPLVIKNAMMIDGNGSPPQGPVDILIEGNRIARITPQDPVGRTRRGTRDLSVPGARVIDATGMYVLPGLIDMHTHLSTRGSANRSYDYQLKLFIAHGITTVRDVGSDFKEALDLRGQSAAHKIVAPRIYIYRFWPNDDENPPRNAEEARATVRAYKEAGADGIKLHSLYPEITFALGDEAKKVGLGTAAHLGQSGSVYANAVVASRAGIRTIEHHYAFGETAIETRVQDFPADYNYLHEPDRFHHSPDPWLAAKPEKLEQTLKVLLENGTVLDPTFVTYEKLRDISRARTIPYDEYLTPTMADYWKPRLSRHGGYFQNWTATDEAKWTRMFQKWMAFVNEFKNRGGSVTMGTDAGNSFTLYGFSAVREMELLHHAGFQPLEAISAATAESARALGESTLGQIRPGFLADLLIVEGNPVENLKVLQGTGVSVFTADGVESRRGGVRYTIKDGVVYDAKKVLAEVAAIVRAERGRGTQ